ncbi:D-alanyl-D-alanine carboxypeptidase family protein [Paenibacillus wynnii]|uniref:D-alanyl-D-alanine carboxypeptidase family protein n=1 Tax=Paenibacillus wynnii TaxID=268407 RepID=UPI002794E4A9|nr:D-alanyl-D-alanine carboxypeptidase family protein [Paenibacillus wynnii]MDQ0192272.1 D-alanyl-D-alanine carboxypeptidase [Paenibacillus wynnii]
MSKKLWIVILFIVVIVAGWGIGKYTTPSASQVDGTDISQQPDLQGQPVESEPSAVVGSADNSQDPSDDSASGNTDADGENAVSPSPSPVAENDDDDVKPEPTDAPVTSRPPAKPTDSAEEGSSGSDDSIETAAEPESLTVLVNKQYKLPDNYKPDDLVYPDVPFLFSDKIEKRMMRKTAAAALEELFAAARKDGVHLAGVSAYRSQSTQTRLFNNYVARDGEAKARTYSAVPGHSEHQTGLAIDVSGSDGKCAAESCFAGTKEANWLEKHVAEFGYIIRFPEGKQSITGYKYEPWHIRYVGTEIASSVVDRDITLEEYYDAVPVSR